MNKENWVEMFKQVGLTEEQMKNWHRIFEKNYSQDHEELLKWLGIGDEEIQKIKNI